MPRSSWRPADTLALIVITLLAGGFRLVDLGTPPVMVADEEIYVMDACWYLYQSPSRCVIHGEESNMHPPLGKWLIAAGIRLFGYTPVGWRITAWASGTLSIALLYLLARRLAFSTTGATIAAGLLSIDFLHFVHSRIAMLDTFVTTFGLAAFLCALYDRGSSARGIWRPWRIASGLAAGAATASKWPGVYALAGVILLTVWWEAGRGPRSAWMRNVLTSLPSVVLSFAIIPGAVYAASYIGRLQGDVLALPWISGSWWGAFVHRQQYMLRFHTGNLGVNTWQSPAWSWILLRRPVVYFFEESGQRLREILALGNPLVWWPSMLAVGVAAARWIRTRAEAETVILVGVAATYLPWLVADRVRTFMFLFYLLPAVPFLCLAVARLFDLMIMRPWGKVAAAVFAAGALTMTAFYYPVLSARPLSYPAWERRIALFTNCGPPEGVNQERPDARRRPSLRRLSPPPPGWCWI